MVCPVHGQTSWARISESGDASKGEARILEGQVDSIADLLLPHRAHGPSWSRTLM